MCRMLALSNPDVNWDKEFRKTPVQTGSEWSVQVPLRECRLPPN